MNVYWTDNKGEAHVGYSQTWWLLKDIRFQIGGNAVVPKEKNPRTNRSFKNSATRSCGKDSSEKRPKKKYKATLTKYGFLVWYWEETLGVFCLILHIEAKMDSEQRKRITSNITFLKERLGYMDPILDRLVERNVLTMEQRERIEKVQPPTPHKKFNEFIQFLLASPDPGTFPSFIASLEDERYFNIVERLQKDGMFKTFWFNNQSVWKSAFLKTFVLLEKCLYNHYR